MEAYKQVYKLGLMKTFQYRADFYFGLISLFFPLFIQVFLWKGLYSSAASGILYGYTFPQMMMYACFACLLAKILSPDFAYEVNEDIKNGGLAKYVVRPVNYRLYRFFEFLGEKTSLVICSLLLLLCIYAAGGYVLSRSVNMLRFVVFLPVMCLSLMLNFSIYYAVSGLGFWMRESSGILFIISFVGNIISGGIFPLDIFPEPLRVLFGILPFSYTTYFPVSILCGTAHKTGIIAGVLLQVFWIGVCSGAGRLVWKAGMKNYSAVGG
jgi:ABC-type uncharacterized transport system, permease component